MKEYIEKTKAQIFLRTECVAKYPTSFASGLLAAVDQLNKLPTADVVEVVRCKDCRYWGGATYGYICNAWSGINMKNYTKPTEFCSFGERKEQG